MVIKNVRNNLKQTRTIVPILMSAKVPQRGNHLELTTKNSSDWLSCSKTTHSNSSRRWILEHQTSMQTVVAFVWRQRLQSTQKCGLLKTVAWHTNSTLSQLPFNHDKFDLTESKLSPINLTHNLDKCKARMESKMQPRTEDDSPSEHTQESKSA